MGVGLGAATAGITAMRIPRIGSSGMLGNTKGLKETVSPGTSSACATAMATSAMRPEPTTIHSGRSQGRVDSANGTTATSHGEAHPAEDGADGQDRKAESE